MVCVNSFSYDDTFSWSDLHYLLHGCQLISIKPSPPSRLTYQKKGTQELMWAVFKLRLKCWLIQGTAIENYLCKCNIGENEWSQSVGDAIWHPCIGITLVKLTAWCLTRAQDKTSTSSLVAQPGDNYAENVLHINHHFLTAPPPPHPPTPAMISIANILTKGYSLHTWLIRVNLLVMLAAQTYWNQIRLMACSHFWSQNIYGRIHY